LNINAFNGNKTNFGGSGNKWSTICGYIWVSECKNIYLVWYKYILQLN
jgi:hypothetical protein